MMRLDAPARKRMIWCRRGDSNPIQPDAQAGHDNDENGLSENNQTSSNDCDCTGRTQENQVQPPSGTEKGEKKVKPHPGDLAKLADLWPKLPEKVRQSIIAIAESAAGE